MIPLGILASSVRRAASGALLEPTNLVATLVEPTLTDPHWDNVAMLLHFDGDLTDETGRTWAGSANFAPSPEPFGLQLETTAYPTSSERVDFGSDPFTIELFHTRRGPAPSSYIAEVALSQRASSSGWELRVDNSPDGLVHVLFVNAGADWGTAYNSPGPRLERNHIAICRYPDMTAKAFLNGEPFREWNNARATRSTSAPLTIGRSSWSSNRRPANALLDEIRITVGVARYDEPFTPPTEPFPNFGPNPFTPD